MKFAFNGHIGLGYEDPGAYGVPVARTKFARILEFNVEDSHNAAYPPTSRVAGLEDAVLGDYDVKFNGRIEARPETVGAWLKAHAGDASVTTTQPDVGGSPTVYEHVITHKDTRQPISAERKLGNITGDPNADLVQGGVVSELVYEFADGMLVQGVSGIGQKKTLVAHTVPTFDTKRAFAKYEGAIKLGGALVGCRAAKVTLKRKVVEDDYDIGSRYRVDADVADVTAEIECEVAVRDMSLIRRSLGAANATAPQDDPLYNADEFRVVGPTIENAYKNELKVTLPRVHWEIASPPMRGKDAMVQTIKGTALHDSVNGHVWQALLRNTQATL